MAETRKATGEIAWLDLTVPDAKSLRDFYASVVGWTITPIDMGGYDDFCMNAPGSGETVSGVCHARGSNVDLPPVWLPYIVVDDIEGSIGRCEKSGGELVLGPKDMGPQGHYCVIRDPAGAYLALFQYAEGSE